MTGYRDDMKRIKPNKRIYAVGSGTLGPVMPLIAVCEAMREKDICVSVRWFGTRPIEEKLTKECVDDFSLFPEWKLDRDHSIRGILNNIRMIVRFIPQVFRLLNMARTEKPASVISAGGFLSVPVAYVCKYFAGSKIILYHQDFFFTLTNKLIKPIADHVCVALEKQKAFFKNADVHMIFHPIRCVYTEAKPISKETARNRYGLDSDKPLVLALGGGTGAKEINDIVWKELYPRLSGRVANYVVLHITGNEKESHDFPNISGAYAQVPFLDPSELAPIMLYAKLAISRAGWATMSELGLFAKNVIFIPLPNSPQEENAGFARRRNASISVPETETWHASVTKYVSETYSNDAGKNLHAIFPQSGANTFASLIDSWIR